ncbi:hypothetical protein P3T76_008133 [Phytophthora citrophthora]|uniref:Uncharacterized protein n=1 Tax=Phytophthora citrophthora TaxID=4793 RepID=A0AAD9GLE7_9STRA|nr:hypothetical protein P3T76_008133 [Phytophthora citrophthora]
MKYDVVVDLKKVLTDLKDGCELVQLHFKKEHVVTKVAVPCCSENVFSIDTNTKMARVIE